MERAARDRVLRVTGDPQHLVAVDVEMPAAIFEGADVADADARIAALVCGRCERIVTGGATKSTTPPMKPSLPDFEAQAIPAFAARVKQLNWTEFRLEFLHASERRTALLIDATISGLPPFLTADGGVNSGLMILQYTAAALASENKVLAHPASVDSIPSSDATMISPFSTSRT